MNFQDYMNQGGANRDPSCRELLGMKTNREMIKQLIAFVVCVGGFIALALWGTVFGDHEDNTNSTKGCGGCGGGGRG